ncbi:nuclear transport factor 2 family protein [Rhodococcus triatomae]|uniref:SnoaL-like domain-containing protein n=1 Tax=Rhodococcus triatomae TaxID=300028 RepID=A0A1G8A210_9NOCA|nr:nuclear transport factor 2 family protein [Rhodococcus triatomae]QNG17881.1 nuclear transport factor 2 family protein [Rhodococcus triatomae]QNG22451.1 nuclear transport factor 2 family protein [Rhodococcus triatomae]SDH14938.1 SnoaL-like domain-containing protein [Rhodococcus triatomae]
MDHDAIREIHQLKHRFARTLDTKSWPEFTETMIPEATAIYGEYLRFDTRDSFVSFLENTLGTHVITEHQCCQPEIEMDGDTATGVWFLADTTIVPEDGLLLRGSAYYHDRYVRDDAGRWRIAYTSFERTWESAIALSDIPSFRLAFNKWDMLEPPASA